MIYKKLGASEMEVSIIGFGCWPIGGEWTGSCDENSIELINEGIQSGINFFDVAPVYGFGHAEEILGEAVKGKRSKIYIASKCGLRWDGQKRIKRDLSRKSILEEIDDSLRRLKTDYIDLYQIHWPDPNTPLEETIDTLNMLKKEGKIRNIGVSNFSVFLTEQAKKYGEIISNQVLFNMIDKNTDHYHDLPLCYRTEKEILPYAQKSGIGIIPYSPLAQGLLTEDFDINKLNEEDVRRANPELIGEQLAKNMKIVQQLKQLASEYGFTLQHLALNWLICFEQISTVIVAPTKIQHIKENVASVEKRINPDIVRRANLILENV